MLYLTEHARARSEVTPRARVSRSNAGSVSTQQNQNASADRVNLTARAQNSNPTNPYAGVAPSSSKVKVGKWGTGQNDSLVGILNSQNYSNDEIFKKDANGVSLLDRVTQANKLRNPNLIRAGQELVVPSKEQPKQTAEQNGMREVKVGKWGRDKNGSLYGILSEQGFSRKQILGDGGNESLLHKVAKANGLKSPDKIREGQTLTIPGSLEAANGLNSQQNPVPEQTTARSKVEPLETIKPKPIALELPKPEIKPVDVKPEVSSTSTTATPSNERVTANMGLLLDGIKEGKFKKDEFQYLNALSNRYEETRAQFSKDGFSNEELKSLGKFETNYGVTYTRLYNSDDVRLTNSTSNSATTAKGQLRVRHFEEGGQLWEGYNSGAIDTEAALAKMVQQRQEARAQGVQE